MLVALILAGGSGERFWPLSTKEHPKQTLKLFSNKEMIRETIDRIIDIIPLERIFIATNAEQVELIKEIIPELKDKNYIIEPMFKDTAAAIGYGTFYINKLIKNSTIAVLASDHLIKKEDQFRKTLLLAYKEAAKGDIITLGIVPSRAETGYGYIELNKSYDLNMTYDVINFKEKPNYEIAFTYLNSGKHLWNSGMFIYKVNTLIDAMKTYAKEHYDILIDIDNGVDIKTSFEKFKKISIDYAIMEKARNIKVIPIDIGWNDVGSYNAFDDIFEKNENNSIIKNDKTIEIDSKNNIVIGNKTIALLGVNDLVIVETEDAILIANKNDTNNIKKIIDELGKK